jgi:uncharacterized protein
MPLEPGKSAATKAHNIAKEIRAGKSQAQAVAIAYHEAGEDELPGERKPAQQMRFYTPQQVGKKQSLTNEGFLLCSDVPIARTGELIYGPDETPLEAGKDGIVRVSREMDEVFRPETLASFEGKPVTHDHPPEEVSPDNYREYVVGVCQNVRRGTGIEDNLILADLLIYDSEAIEAVRDGKREISCGYDADYEQVEPGRGRQKNIVGNHVALVEQGRCGPICSIQDRSPNMSKKTVMDRIKAAFTLKDEKALDKALQELTTDEGVGHGVELHVHNYGGKGAEEHDEEKESKEGKGAEDVGEGSSVEERLTKIEECIKKLVEGKSNDESEEEEEDTYDEEKEDKEEGKEGKKTGDSKVEKLVQELASRAEILVPGFKIPTFDAKVKDQKKFKDAFCRCQLKVLRAAYATDDGKKLIAPFLSGISLDSDKLTATTIDAVFSGAVALAKTQNNNAAGKSKVTVRDFGKPTSVADINKRNAEFWQDRKSA